jgi:hypothetical protein
MDARLTATQHEQFQRDGYLVLRGFFARDDLAAVDRETDALLARDDLKDPANLRVRWKYHCETGEPLFDCFDPVIDLSPGARALANDPRLRAVLEDLHGDRVHLFKDSVTYKLGGAFGEPPHWNFFAWSGFPRSFTTAVIAIDGASAENGCIEVFPGAHAQGGLAEHGGILDALPDEVLGGVAPVALDLAPGDVAFFGAFMPHRSDTNRTDSSRRHLFFSYNADRDGGEQRAPYYEAFDRFRRAAYGMQVRREPYFR